MKTFKQFLIENYEHVPVSFPKSEHHYPDQMMDYHKRRGDKPESMTFHPNQFRATQPIINKNWKPEHSKNSDEPTGVVHKGLVHIVDGHHRAEEAYKNNKPFKVKVYNHNGHAFGFKKYMDKEYK